MTTTNVTAETPSVGEQMKAYAIKYGAREVHCSHRDHGICVTPSGYTKKACQSEIDAMVSDDERTMIGAEYAWVFPSQEEFGRYFFDAERKKALIAGSRAALAAATRR